MKKSFLFIFLIMSISPVFSQDSRIAYIENCTLIDGDENVIFKFRNYDRQAKYEYPYLQYPDSEKYIIRGTGKIFTVPDSCTPYAIVEAKKLIIIQRFDKRGVSVINTNHETLIPFDKYEQIDYWKDDLFFARKEGNHWGIINSKDQIVLPFLYSYFYPYSTPLATNREVKPHYFCIIDKNGKEHLPFTDFDKIARAPLSISDSIIIAGINHTFSTFDLNGNVIIPHSRNYRWMWHYSEGYAFFQNEHGLWGIVNKAGEEVIPATYSGVSANYGSRSNPIMYKPQTFTDGLACMLINGEGYGAIDKTGKVVVPFEYIGLSPFANGLAIAIKGETVLGKRIYRYGVINKDGKVVIPFEYEHIGQFLNGNASATKDRKTGIINIKNEVVMPFKFYKIVPFTDSLFIEVPEPPKKSPFNPTGYLE